MAASFSSGSIANSLSFIRSFVNSIPDKASAAMINDCMHESARTHLRSWGLAGAESPVEATALAAEVLHALLGADVLDLEAASLALD